MHKLMTPHGTVTGLWDTVYARYLSEIMSYGETYKGRNGETKAVFGYSVIVNLKQGFPLTQLRKMPVKNLFREFLFDIGFDSNVNALGPAKHFWDFLADDEGNLGASAYNRQWRRWPQSAKGANIENEVLSIDRPVDQLQRVIAELRHSPNSRRATVITHNPTAYNPACPPCHIALQFMPGKDGLDMMVPARSNDMIVGFPLDIARYAVLLTVVAKAVGMVPHRLYMPSTNSHIYENCYGIANTLIMRDKLQEPQLRISEFWRSNSEYPLEILNLEHFEVEGYTPHDAIKVAVN